MKMQSDATKSSTSTKCRYMMKSLTPACDATIGRAEVTGAFTEALEASHACTCAAVAVDLLTRHASWETT